MAIDYCYQLINWIDRGYYEFKVLAVYPDGSKGFITYEDSENNAKRTVAFLKNRLFNK